VIALLAILIAAAPARLFAQGGPDGGVPDDPSTAKTIKPTDALVPDAPTKMFRPTQIIPSQKSLMLQTFLRLLVIMRVQSE
jgi:hypothetical protein